MDNFDEDDEKLLIEIGLNELNKNALRDIIETENLLQNDNTKLVLQSRNPYVKLAFIKSLKDNLICLGYLEETIDTLNYASEDLINSTIISMSNAPKKRKMLTQKRSQERQSPYILTERTTEYQEVK